MTFFFTMYILIRSLGYVLQPKPYLWWHAAMDGFVILFALGLAVLHKWVIAKEVARGTIRDIGADFELMQGFWG